MSKTTYYERNSNVILNRAKDYYEEQKINIENYLKNKNIKREYGRNRHYNMSEEKKQRLKEYQSIYREAKKHLS